MPSRKPPAPVYQLKVTLLRTKPPIWRRFQVPATIKLCCLHSAIQVAMGWTDSHLHLFQKGDKRWGVPESDDYGDLNLIDEGDTRLADVLGVEGESVVYQYDFGDNWEHQVVLEKMMLGPNQPPVCLDGARRCPPEDVGGTSGYEEFLEVICDPQHEEYEHYAGWAGGHFVDEFDPKAANAKLARTRWPVRHRY